MNDVSSWRNQKPSDFSRYPTHGGKSHNRCSMEKTCLAGFHWLAAGSVSEYVRSAVDSGFGLSCAGVDRITIRQNSHKSFVLHERRPFIYQQVNTEMHIVLILPLTARQIYSYWVGL